MSTSTKKSAGADGGKEAATPLVNELKHFHHVNTFRISIKKTYMDRFTTKPHVFAVDGFHDFMDDYFSTTYERARVLFPHVRLLNPKMVIRNITGYTRNFKLTSGDESNSTQNTPNGFQIFKPMMKQSQNGIFSLTDADGNQIPYKTNKYNATFISPRYQRSYRALAGSGTVNTLDVQSGETDLTAIANMYDIEYRCVTGYNFEPVFYPISTNKFQPDRAQKIPYFDPSDEESDYEAVIPSRISQADMVSYQTKMEPITMSLPDTAWMPSGDCIRHYDDTDVEGFYSSEVEGSAADAAFNVFQQHKVGDSVYYATWPRKLLEYTGPRQNLNVQLDSKGASHGYCDSVILAALPHFDTNGVAIPQYFNCNVTLTADIEFRQSTGVPVGSWDESDDVADSRNFADVAMIPPLAGTLVNSDNNPLYTRVIY